MNQDTINKIITVAASSKITKYEWKGRGLAPVGFYSEMAVYYGMMYEKLKAGDSTAKAMIAHEDGAHDVFDHYQSQLNSVGIFTLGASATDRLRALFVIMTGLAGRESSFGFDIGQDASAPTNRTADRAEAGWFQQSWDSLKANPVEIRKIFEYYFDNPTNYQYIYSQHAAVRSGALINYGGGDGARFQQLAKSCPAFAVQACGLALRRLCNAWGPINSWAVEIRPEVDSLYTLVQHFIDDTEVDIETRPSILSLRWIDIAKQEIGFHERGVNLGIERYIRGGKTGGEVGEPWCADFVNYCLETAGFAGTRSAMARSFERSTNFIKLNAPAYGAIVTMWRGSPGSGSGHVFFYMGENVNGVLGLGGNQKDSVCKQYNPHNRIIGYYWPKSAPLPTVGKISVVDNDASDGTEV